MYRVKYKVCIIAYKLSKGLAPTYLMDKVKMFNPTCDKSLRCGPGRDKWMFHSDITVHRSSNYISKMIVEYNALPMNLRKAENINTFKSNLKTFYFKKAFG